MRRNLRTTKTGIYARIHDKAEHLPGLDTSLGALNFWLIFIDSSTTQGMKMNQFSLSGGYSSFIVADIQSMACLHYLGLGMSVR